MPEISSMRFISKHAGKVYSIERVNDFTAISEEEVSDLLVASFVGEYKQYLQPKDIDKKLKSWEEVREYYRQYASEEIEDYKQGKIDYWVQAKIENKTVGFATFLKQGEAGVYMNLLAVSPSMQHQGVGQRLVYAPMELGIVENLCSIHLLLRKKNRGGRLFYEKLGFKPNPDYVPLEENFVSMDLLEPLTWTNPSYNPKNQKVNYKQNVSSTFFGVSIEEPREKVSQCDLSLDF